MGFSPIEINFNGNNLSQIVNGVEFLNRGVNSLPDRDLKQYKLARSDKSIVTSAEYIRKQIAIDGIIARSSRALGEDALSDLKGLMQAREKDLIISQAGLSITYKATLDKIIENDFSGGLMKFTLMFEASDPVGVENVSRTLLASISNSDSTNEYSIAVGGSFKAEPYFTIHITYVTGGTDGSITISNTELGQGITLTADFADGDDIIIDCLEKEVYINNIAVEFTGVFPSYPSGSRSVGYSDTFTTRSVDIAATYKRRYI